MTKNPIERLREELARPPLFSERNGYAPLDRAPLLGILDEIEAQYMKLPVDADGIPIRPGDMMQMAFGDSAEVDAVDTERWFFNHSCLADDDDEYDFEWAENSRHVKQDTVESQLAEFLKDVVTYHNVYVPDWEKDEFGEHLRELRDSYAERIRKAVEHGD